LILFRKGNPNQDMDHNEMGEVFLQKALENLAKNKLHYTEESNEFLGKI
jgi:hypothetical protein